MNVYSLIILVKVTLITKIFPPCCLLLSQQTTLPEFSESDFSVTRDHDEFLWLHTMYDENEDYAGVIVSLMY